MGQSSSSSHDSASGLRRSPFYALLKVQVALGEPQWKSASSAAASASARKGGGSSEQRADAFLAQISNEENKLLLLPIFEHFGADFSRLALNRKQNRISFFPILFASCTRWSRRQPRQCH